MDSQHPRSNLATSLLLYVVVPIAGASFVGWGSLVILYKIVSGPQFQDGLMGSLMFGLVVICAAVINFGIRMGNSILRDHFRSDGNESITIARDEAGNLTEHRSISLPPKAGG